MNSTYTYIIVMAITTFLMRLIPLTLLRKKIKNPFIQSFLYYIPYVTLSALIFPSILHSTAHTLSALIGFLCALFLAYREKSLFTVAFSSCIVVYLTELFLL